MGHELDASPAAVSCGVSAAPGAYALLIELEREARLPARLGGGALAPGRYAYLGSARGPGGIRARVARHLTGPHRRHWHVDWLTSATARCSALAFPVGDECDLVGRLLSLAGTFVPVPGFGSSDCRRCPAHLVALDDTISVDALATGLGVDHRSAATSAP